MQLPSLRFVPDNELVSRLVATRRNHKYRTDWVGTITAPAPVVAMSFFHFEDHLYWARSRKATANQISLRLLVGVNTENRSKNLYVTWEIGGCQIQLRVGLESTLDLPDTIKKAIPVGKLFHFANAGTSLTLFGLVLPRSQVKGRRNYLWGLKDEYTDSLPHAWRDILTHGRSGTSSANILYDTW